MASPLVDQRKYELRLRNRTVDRLHKGRLDSPMSSSQPARRSSPTGIGTLQTNDIFNGPRNAQAVTPTHTATRTFATSVPSTPPGTHTAAFGYADTQTPPGAGAHTLPTNGPVRFNNVGNDHRREQQAQTNTRTNAHARDEATVRRHRRVGYATMFVVALLALCGATYALRGVFRPIKMVPGDSVEVRELREALESTRYTLAREIEALRESLRQAEERTTETEELEGRVRAAEVKLEQVKKEVESTQTPMPYGRRGNMLAVAAIALTWIKGWLV